MVTQTSPQPTDLPEHLRAVAAHCWLPATGTCAEWFQTRYEQHCRSAEAGSVAFVYQRTGDWHIRKTRTATGGKTLGLGDWRGWWHQGEPWRKGANGKQLWNPQPATADTRHLLLVEGETAHIVASWLLRDHPQWLIISSTGSNFPADNKGHQTIRNRRWQVLAWPDQDQAGTTWLDLITRHWLADYPVMPFVNYPPGTEMKDCRDWYRHQREQNYGHIEQVLAEQLQAHIEALQAHPDRYRHPPAHNPQQTAPEGRKRDTAGWSPQPATARRSDWNFDVPERDIKDVALKAFGQNLQDAGYQPAGGNQWRCGNTTGHEHGDRNPSVSVDLQAGLYNCHGCQTGGDAVTIAAQVAGQSRKEWWRTTAQNLQQTNIADRPLVRPARKRKGTI